MKPVLFQYDIERVLARVSIQARLLLAASLVLTGFLGITGFSLDHAFRVAVNDRLKDQLQNDIYALLADAEEDEKGRLSMPAVLTDPRFNRPDSGVYLLLADKALNPVWRSPSTLGQSAQIIQPAKSGQSIYARSQAEGVDWMSLSFGILWVDQDNRENEYVLAAAQNLAPAQSQIAAYRATLVRWLGGAALLLLLAQIGVLRWGLQPLRQVAAELKSIETGQSTAIAGEYPKELKLLTDNLNSLLKQTYTREQRYRDSLGDLAHSLKTPLAILHGAADYTGDDIDRRVLVEQVERMNQIVSHQLQRAAASGRKTLVKPIPIKPVIERIAQSLSKVYADQVVQWSVDIEDEIHFRGDEGDLMECLGNLMDNAWKYGRNRVQINAGQIDGTINIRIDDDGPGIPADHVEHVLSRGGRMDMSAPGQGIGLSVVVDILGAYGGSLDIQSSPLGGTRVVISIPE